MPSRGTVPPATLVTLLGSPDIWLLFLLGFGTGLPMYWIWVDMFPRADLAVDRALLLAMTTFGTIGILAMLAAPLLDGHGAPLFSRLGHRRSWVATALSAALVLIVFYLIAGVASDTVATGYRALSGVVVLPVAAVLWIALNALRVELFPGQSQAVAFAVQFLGSAAAWAVTARFFAGPVSSATAAAFAGFLALALGAILLIREPKSLATPAPEPADLGAQLARPWRTFFARHSRATPWLLASIAFYALAGSTADYLGKLGLTIDLTSDQPTVGHDVEKAWKAAATLEITLQAIGAVAGMLFAFRMAPARAFILLVCAYLALIALFLLCKAYLGFTVMTVPALHAVRSLLAGAATCHLRRRRRAADRAARHRRAHCNPVALHRSVLDQRKRARLFRPDGRQLRARCHCSLGRCRVDCLHAPRGWGGTPRAGNRNRLTAQPYSITLSAHENRWGTARPSAFAPARNWSAASPADRPAWRPRVRGRFRHPRDASRRNTRRRRAASFDHLVGANEQRLRDREA